MCFERAEEPSAVAGDDDDNPNLVAAGRQCRKEREQVALGASDAGRLLDVEQLHRPASVRASSRETGAIAGASTLATRSPVARISRSTTTTASFRMKNSANTSVIALR